MEPLWPRHSCRWLPAWRKQVRLPADRPGSGGADPLFFGAAFACETQSASYSAGNTSNEYVFDGGLFTNTLSFDTVLQDMTVYISAFFVDVGNTAFLSRIGSQERA